MKQRSCKGVHTRRSFILNLLSQLFTKSLYFKSVFSPALKIMIFEEISKEHSSNIHKGFCPVFFSMNDFLYQKTIFLPEPQFSQQILEIFWGFLNIFLNFISLFSLIVYLVRFNANNKRNFLTYVLTCASNYKQTT